MEDETLDQLMLLEFGVIIWWFPQYKWKYIALFRKETANA